MLCQRWFQLLCVDDRVSSGYWTSKYSALVWSVPIIGLLRVVINAFAGSTSLVLLYKSSQSIIGFKSKTIMWETRIKEYRTIEYTHFAESVAERTFLVSVKPFHFDAARTTFISILWKIETEMGENLMTIILSILFY